MKSGWENIEIISKCNENREEIVLKIKYVFLSIYILKHLDLLIFRHFPDNISIIPRRRALMNEFGTRTERDCLVLFFSPTFVILFLGWDRHK